MTIWGVSWFNLHQQLSPEQPLAQSPAQWDGKENQKGEREPEG